MESIFTRNISLSLKEKPMKIKISAKKSDLQFLFRTFRNKIAELSKQIDTSERYLEQLKRMYLRAATKGSSKTLKLLEEKLGLLEKADKERDDAKRVYFQIKQRLGENPAAQKLLQESKILIKRTEDIYSKITKTVRGIAEKQSPVILREGEIIKKLESLLNKELVKVNKNRPKGTKKCKIGEESFTIDSNKKGLVFVRYLTLNNVPKSDKSLLKTLYIPIITNLPVPKQKKGKIIGEFSDLSITFSLFKVRPIKLHKIYKIRNTKEMEGVLSFLSYENNLSLFGGVIKVNQKKRLEQLGKQGKVRILTDPGTKINIKGNKIKIVVPKKDTRDLEGGLDRKFIKDLFVEVKRLAGLPMRGPKSLEDAGRLKYKVKETKLNVIITFTVLPMVPEQERKTLPVQETPLMIEEESPVEQKNYINKLIKDLT